MNFSIFFLQRANRVLDTRPFGRVSRFTYSGFHLLFVLCLFALISSCQKEDDNPAEPTLEPLEERLAGEFSIYDKSPNAFSQAGAPLSGDAELSFFVGNSFFNQNWVTAPASTTARDGLGPVFNSRSCSGCHFKDGRGRAPAFDGERSTGFLLRLSVPGSDIHGEPLPDPVYGGQLQDQAVAKVPVEGQFRIVYEELQGSYADGTPYSLRDPQYILENLAFGPASGDLMISPRVANQMIGLGLLEAIPEQAILRLADANDADRDGISGRPNYVWDRKEQRQAIGRFGWKANMPSMHQQTAGAFLGDLGITTDLFPDENCTSAQQDCSDAANGGAPEIEEDDLIMTVLYGSVLGVPVRRNVDDANAIRGATIFRSIGCTGCHVETFVTGPHDLVPELAGQTIHPYTDLLLHDMGDGLSDGRPDFEATGNEWRTPPLWGIGLFETVNGHTEYLHDGRARNLAEAILWHGGEAQASRDRFTELSQTERAQLLTFLNSL